MKRKFMMSILVLMGVVFIQSCKKDHREEVSPHLTFAPESGAKESVIAINGAGFSANISQNAVSFNGVAATVLTATSTTLTVRVPIAAGSGKITVNTGGTVMSSTNDFTYLYTVSTLAGDGVAGFKEGVGTSAEFKFPFGITVDQTGNVYVGDQGNYRVRKITPQGEVTTLAGNGTPGFADGAADIAEFNDPEGVAVDVLGNVYVADFANYRIRKISSGVVSTLAGNGVGGFNDGPAATAQFFDPEGITVDAFGNVYVAEYGNSRIRKIAAGQVSTVAGNGIEGYNDGLNTTAEFDTPFGVTLDASGNLYVADFRNNRIRKISGSTTSTLAGDGMAAFKDGPRLAAQFFRPTGVAADALGNVYVADRGNHRIRKITTAGVVTTIAGNGTPGFEDGEGLTTQFSFPSSIAIDASGNIYVTDNANHRIRKLQ